MGYRETEARQRAKGERHVCYRFKETTKKRSEKLELLLEAAMPCKVKNHQYGETCANPTTLDQSMHASQELTTLRDGVWKEKNCCGKGFNSVSHYNLAHKFILTHPQ